MPESPLSIPSKAGIPWGIFSKYLTFSRRELGSEVENYGKLYIGSKHRMSKPFIPIQHQQTEKPAPKRRPHSQKKDLTLETNETALEKGILESLGTRPSTRPFTSAQSLRNLNHSIRSKSGAQSQQRLTLSHAFAMTTKSFTKASRVTTASEMNRRSIILIYSGSWNLLPCFSSHVYCRRR